MHLSQLSSYLEQGSPLLSKSYISISLNLVESCIAHLVWYSRSYSQLTSDAEIAIRSNLYNS